MTKKPNKKSSFLIIAVIFFFLTLGLLKLSYDNSLTKPNTDSGEKVFLEIKEGESVNNILNLAIDNGLLRKNYFYFAKTYLKLNNLETKIQAGVYELPKNLSLVELINSLLTGRSQDIWVTIPEGLRKDEIADIVEKELVKDGLSSFSKTEFLSLSVDKTFIDSLGLVVDTNDLEGFLFPDKYAFPKDATTALIIEKLVDNFNNKVGANYTYQDVILASIVEREGFNEDDRPIIAGIIIKRFKEGWLLQTDATLLYPVKDWKHAITIQDKQDDNPYNTYQKLGLPPTPICNPGLQALKAVWEPTNTQYYYYIHDKEKNPHYATTLDEHNANVYKYLR
jgi:UPF0755 protein